MKIILTLTSQYYLVDDERLLKYFPSGCILQIIETNDIKGSLNEYCKLSSYNCWKITSFYNIIMNCPKYNVIAHYDEEFFEIMIVHWKKKINSTKINLCIETFEKNYKSYLNEIMIKGIIE